jgi:hypothetical protein
MKNLKSHINELILMEITFVHLYYHLSFLVFILTLHVLAFQCGIAELSAMIQISCVSTPRCICLFNEITVGIFFYIFHHIYIFLKEYFRDWNLSLFSS